MPRVKLMIPPNAIRRLGIAKLRETLATLQKMSDLGEVVGPEVYNTYVAIAKEIERRGTKAQKPASLISKGASKLMKIGDIRAKIAELRQLEQTEEVRNTIVILSEETGRRSMLAKRTYDRRKGEAQAFMEARA